MRILEILFSLSVSEFAVPDQKVIVEKAESIQACRENPNVHADCKNILQRYLEMKEKTGEPYVNIH